MNNAIVIFTLIGFAVIGLLYYFWYKEQKRNKKELEELQKLEEKLRLEKEARKILHDFFKIRFERIEKAKDEFANYLEHSTGYFSNYTYTVWKKQYSILYEEIKNKSFEHIGFNEEEVATIKKFNYYYDNALQLKSDFNPKFISQELKDYKKFFKDIEKHGLDKEQQIAVVTDDDNSIIVAGAGSGKTTTIVGKVNYVIDRYNTLPSDILLISFTRKSASTLAGRIDVEGVEAKTFHKFGKDVIRDVEGTTPAVFSDNEDEANRTSELKEFIKKIFNELLKERSYMKKAIGFFTYFLKEPKSQFDFDSKGEYIQYMRDKNFKTFKVIQPNGRTTLHREIVKSIEECRIANFLFLHNIEYKYEERYEVDTATYEYGPYKPDFSIYKDGKRVYLEHFAIGRDGTVPHWFERNGNLTATEKYKQGIDWKRSIHTQYNTTLLETYSYEMFEGVLFDNLTQRLQVIGIVPRRKPIEEIWKIISENGKEDLKGLIDLFGTFITLMKSNNYNIDDVTNKNESIENKFHQKRNKSFIELIKPIYEKYEKLLLEGGEIDFSDMINKASKYISNGQYKKRFSYVIIDEFQDLSIGRYQLIRAIKESNPSCKLFCVGDDWQSIYRFSGSDIALFKNFGEFFGHTVKSKIETTYRFHNPLITLSSDFILKNSNQEKKNLRSTGYFKSTKSNIVYSSYDRQNKPDDTFALKKVFDEILLMDGFDEKEIYILGRYSFDINRIKNEYGTFQIDREKGKISYSQRDENGDIKKIIAHFMTVHKAKGLEADIVVILNCNSGKYGFPSEMSDDTVLNLVLSEADQFPNGEERRLFYVAMTRAKEMVYFVTNSDNKSKFILELESKLGTENEENKVRKCPSCRTADLIKRSGTKNGKQWAFWGCSNYMYGCSYQEWI